MPRPVRPGHLASQAVRATVSRSEAARRKAFVESRFCALVTIVVSSILAHVTPLDLSCRQPRLLRGCLPAIFEKVDFLAASRANPSP